MIECNCKQIDKCKHNDYRLGALAGHSFHEFAIRTAR